MLFNENYIKSEEPKKIIMTIQISFECFIDNLLFSICQRKHGYSDFDKKIIETLNTHATKKVKTFQGNQNLIKLRKSFTKKLQIKEK